MCVVCCVLCVFCTFYHENFHRGSCPQTVGTQNVELGTIYIRKFGHFCPCYVACTWSNPPAVTSTELLEAVVVLLLVLWRRTPFRRSVVDFDAINRSIRSFDITSNGIVWRHAGWCDRRCARHHRFGGRTTDPDSTPAPVPPQIDKCSC